ncbi:hypothetical protein CVU37_05220 [candidate division BRC1 bacterium HGW-BRC1-1]|jgi:hypothetical protein|nr:MAG: hypothetical protein CVU37_05220 [candidate division BRC1 bacterium HGW-BRC1-1]
MPISPAKKRAIIGATITLLWVVMMFLLVRDNIIPQRRAQNLAATSIDPATLTANWHDIEEPMLIRFKNKGIGGALTRITRADTTATLYHADMRFILNLDMLDLSRRVQINAQAELNSGFNLSKFHLEGNLAALTMSITGVEHNGELLIEVRHGDETPARARYTMDKSISFLEAVRPLALRNFKIETGAAISLPVVDPVWSMELGTAEISVGPREKIELTSGTVEAFRVETRLNDIVSSSWVDEQGLTLRRQIAGGFTLDRADLAEVLRAAPHINKPAEPYGLNPADFADITPRPLKSIADPGSSPLAVLSQFAQ